MTTSVPSATTWGSPASTKHALLIHGLTSSSHVWHRVAPALAAQGFFVTAPNLIGHVSRAASDYHLSSIAKDLLPYLEARNYSLIIGHSLGGATAINLFPYLPQSHPTAFVLVDASMRLSPEILDFLDNKFADVCTNIKPAEAHGVENPLWAREDNIYRELGTRLCAADTVHQILGSQNRPWDHFKRLDGVSKAWKVTALVADPAIGGASLVEYFQPYPHVRALAVPGAGHWIPNEFPDVVVEEALKAVAELDNL